MDSHLELPVVTGDLAAALEPFRAAVDAGVQTVMTAHVVVPELGDAPATLNERVVTGILRDELGFDGVVVADALEMRAVSATVGVEAAAVRALAAGVDLLCVGHDLDELDVARIESAIVNAVCCRRPGGGSTCARRQRRVDAARRLGACRIAPGRRRRRRCRRSTCGSVSGDAALAADASIVELRPRANIAAGEHEHRLPGAVVVREGEPVPDADAYVVRDAHRHAWMRAVADRDDAVVIEVGLPVWRPARARGYVATYGAGRASLDAAAEALRGPVRA